MKVRTYREKMYSWLGDDVSESDAEAETETETDTDTISETETENSSIFSTPNSSKSLSPYPTHHRIQKPTNRWDTLFIQYPSIIIALTFTLILNHAF